jgi:cytochrome P450
MSNMILGLPASTARQAFASGAATFEKYFANGHHHQASALIEARYKHSTDHHLPLNDIGQSEFSNGVALLSNTIPNSFWMLYHVYSDPTVLADCRSELSRIVALGKNNTATLDISKVKTACPVLLSTYKEVLRLYSAAVSARLVMKDHMLDNQFLLKAGSTVLMPAPVQHHSAAVWGSDNSTFNHRRFADAKSTNQAGFRAFGGGTTLCPGRHFATTEILAFTAIMVLQYDVVPVGGSWGAKMESDAEFWESSSRPVGDVEVEIRERAGEWKGKQWAFTLSDLEEPIALSAEDMPDFAH